MLFQEMNSFALKVCKKILDIQVTIVKESFTEWQVELDNLSASFKLATYFKN